MNGRFQIGVVPWTCGLLSLITHAPLRTPTTVHSLIYATESGD